MSVRVELGSSGIAELILDRPEALNALNTEHAQLIADACDRLAGDSTCRVVVVSSAVEKAFCVGADLKERARFTDHDLRHQRPIMRAAFRGVLNLPMPTIAAVEGYALGGGCEIALGCDLIVASDTAVFALPEVGVGLVPGGGGTQLLPRRVGVNPAADLIFTTRQVPADDAYAMGLADRRCRAGDARAVALELAGQIAAKSPVAVRYAKLALRQGFDRPLADALEVEDLAWQRAAFSPDRVEGIAAFNEKRAPVWPGLQAARREHGR
jgi:enoyl-CoA hydratase/carnithine racemase